MPLTYLEQRAIQKMEEEVKIMKWKGAAPEHLHAIAMQLRVFQGKNYSPAGRVVVRFNAILHKMRSGQNPTDIVAISESLEELKGALEDPETEFETITVPGIRAARLPSKY